jgi:hypothetical protein
LAALFCFKKKHKRPEECETVETVEAVETVEVVEEAVPVQGSYGEVQEEVHASEIIHNSYGQTGPSPQYGNGGGHLDTSC